MQELPIGLALILCDTVIEDCRTKKKSLIGLFSTIKADTFPYTHPSLNVLISLTGCIGAFPCHLICERNEDAQLVLSASTQINSQDPHAVIDMVVNIKAIPFEKPGKYTFKVLVDNVPIMMRPIIVSSMPVSTDKQPKTPIN